MLPPSLTHIAINMPYSCGEFDATSRARAIKKFIFQFPNLKVCLLAPGVLDWPYFHQLDFSNDERVVVCRNDEEAYETPHTFVFGGPDHWDMADERIREARQKRVT